MKIKTHLRAGARSGTVGSGNKRSSSTDSTSSEATGDTSGSTVVVVSTTRCAGY